MTEQLQTMPVAACPTQSAVHIVFTGRVQGVGFRQTTALLARDYPVSGSVGNLPDGRVELYAEGDASAVQAFLEAVRRRWRGNIRSEQVEQRSPTGISMEFEITR